MYLQGSLPPEEDYPPSFFTFWNFETLERYYDDEPWACTWSYDVNFYTSDPAIRISTMKDAAIALRAAGYVVEGVGEDIDSDVQTHTGRTLVCRFTEKY